MTSFMTTQLVLLVTQLTVMTWAGNGNVCMTCSCDDGICDVYKCCWTFNTETLYRLTVSVDCDSTLSVDDPARQQSNATQAHQPFITDVAKETKLAIKRNSSDIDHCYGYHLAQVSCLTRVPTNICDYPEIRAVTLYYNSIAEFPHLGCLPLLGKLDLSHNKLTEIPQDAFRGFEEYITEIHLENNMISYIHPEAFALPMPRLYRINLSYNRLVGLEGGILGVPHPFCNMDFSHNQLSRITNERQWQFEPYKEYGPGYVDFSYNNFTKGPTEMIKQLGVPDLRSLSRFIRWGWDFRDNPFHCDCTAYGISLWYRQLKAFLWRDYFNVTCSTPVKYRDIPVYDLPLEELTCDVSSNCPLGCHCLRQPLTLSLVVDCRDVTLISLPGVMPVVEVEEKLVLLFQNTSIYRVEVREYLGYTKEFNVRASGVEVVEEEAVRLLKEAEVVDLRGNNLRHLPEALRVLSPDRVLLEDNPLQCSCELRWFQSWLLASSGDHLENLTCWADHSGRILFLAQASSEQIGCKESYSGLLSARRVAIATGVVVAVVVVVVVAVVAGLALLRYEVTVAVQYWAARRALRTDGQKQSRSKYDVFISVHPDSVEDTGWLRRTLLPTLDTQGVTTYLPPRDCPGGCVEMDEMTKRLHDCSAALVVVSPDYVSLPACLFQFRQAFSHMVARKQGPLLVVLLRPVQARAVSERRLRAMLKMGLVFQADDMKKVVDVLVERKRQRKENAAEHEDDVYANVEDPVTDVDNGELRAQNEYVETPGSVPDSVVNVPAYANVM